MLIEAEHAPGPKIHVGSARVGHHACDAKWMARWVDQDPPVIGIRLNVGFRGAQFEDPDFLGIEVRDSQL